jgi:ribosomal protein S12 methylthiotransferase accessory factor
MQYLSSSLRERPLALTYKYALEKAKDLNITRVTDTTFLDKVGVPVFASIRPLGNSLCVNAGKGFTIDEAKIGALMEAIEFAYGEYGHAKKEVTLVSINNLVNQLPLNVRLEDFGIKFRKRANSDELIACIGCVNTSDNKAYLLPAQLVFIPFDENPGIDLFGVSTNGLASGNSVQEATIHAICELVERDVCSFNRVKDASVWVDVEKSTIKINSLKEKIESAGLTLSLRYTDNQFNLPFFESYIIDDFNSDYISTAKGLGLHPVKEVAAIRAITEALQSRLSCIHGGRDDIAEVYAMNDALSLAKKTETYLSSKNKALNKQKFIAYNDIKAPPVPASLDEAMQILENALSRNDIKDIFRYVFTNPDDHLHVVKIIIPKLEYFNNKSKRMGPRLFSYILSERD